MRLNCQPRVHHSEWGCLRNYIEIHIFSPTFVNLPATSNNQDTSIGQWCDIWALDDTFQFQLDQTKFTGHQTTPSNCGFNSTNYTTYGSTCSNCSHPCINLDFLWEIHWSRCDRYIERWSTREKWSQEENNGKAVFKGSNMKHYPLITKWSRHILTSFGQHSRAQGSN